MAAELDLDECERFSEEEEEEDEEEEGRRGSNGNGNGKKSEKRLVFYSHPCRCGGSFVVAEADLRSDCSEVLVPCEGCSSRARVLYGVAAGVGEEGEG